MIEAITLIILGWAIPLSFTWLLSKSGPVQDLAKRNVIAASIVLSGFISVTIGLVSIFAYDRFFSKGIYLVAENGSCPFGFDDRNLILLPRFKDAQDRFQTPKDISPAWYFQSNPDWIVDHAKLCIRN